MSITLNSNEVLSALSNMILNIQTYSDNVAHNYSMLLQNAKDEAGLYGDSKLYIATQALESTDWANDSEAANLLSLNRPAAPDIQRLVINKFRKIFVTIDDYMTKRAFADEGSFSSFNMIVLGWLVDTRQIYETTTYNMFVGTEKTTTGNQAQTITFTTESRHYYDGTNANNTDSCVEANNRLEAEEIAQKVADIMDELADYSTKYNDLGFVRAYKPEDMVVVWNAAWLNKIQKRDLPTIFHNDIYSDITKYKLPGRFFGTRIGSANISTYSASTPTTGKPIDSDDGKYTPGSNNANGKIVSLYEVKVTVGGTAYHLFPGDELPVGATIKSTGGNFGYDQTAIVDSKVICKIMHKKSVPYLTSFTASTEFFNPRSLTKTNFLIFGHSTLQHLKQYPYVTLSQA